MFQVSGFHPTGDHPQGGKFHNRRGNVLLLALLLLTGGIVGSLTVAVLVVSEIRQARSLDNALVGYYDAEGGLEQSLYNIRQDESCADNSCDDLDFNDCTPVLAPNCKIKINPSLSVDIPLIGVDDTFQLDIEPSDNITTIAVNWAPIDGSSLPYLEVSFLNIVAGNTEIVRPNLGVPYYCDHAGGYDDVANLCAGLLFSDSAGFKIGATQTYQVRFKALQHPINDLKIVSNNPPNGTFSGYLQVASRSRKTSIRQELKTSVPSQLPVYGFPDYVIFSEQDIVK